MDNICRAVIVRAALATCGRIQSGIDLYSTHGFIYFLWVM